MSNILMQMPPEARHSLRAVDQKYLVPKTGLVKGNMFSKPCGSPVGHLFDPWTLQNTLDLLKATVVRIAPQVRSRKEPGSQQASNCTLSAGQNILESSAAIGMLAGSLVYKPLLCKLQLSTSFAC